MRSVVGFIFILGALTGPLVAEPTYVMKVLYPGEASARMQSFLADEFKAATVKDLGIELQVSFAPWSVYRDRLDLLIATDTPPDWFWRGTFETGMYVSHKQVLPLDDLLKTYGKNILRVIPAMNFRPNMVDGKIYSIPSQRSATAEKFYTVLARSDLLEMVGVKSIQSFRELLDAAVKIKARFPDITPFASVPWLALLREAAPGWYTYDFGVTLVNENEKEPRVYGFFEQKDIVLKLNAMANTLVQQGLVSPEVLTDPNNDVGRFQSGLCAFWSGAITRPLEQQAAVQRNVPTARLREYTLLPQAPRYIVQASNEAIFIPVGNKHPEQAIRFLDWIYQDQAHYDLMLFGAKGKDYTIDSGNHLVRLTQDELFYEWMFRNDLFLRWPVGISPDFVRDYTNWDKGAKFSKLYGFTFNQESVTAEASRIYALAPRFNPLIWGLVDASKGSLYTEVRDSLRKAGIEKYVAEYNRQLQAYQSKAVVR